MKARSQRESASEWRSRAARLTERAQNLPTDPELLHRPPPRGWSAAQVLEHLVLSNESYLAVMRQALAHPPAATAVVGSRVPRFGGRLLVRSLRSPRPLPAPAGFRPAASPRPEVQTAFVAEMRELVVLLDGCEAIPWNRVRFGSPALVLLRLNLGDGFEILITHAERHFGQIDRTLAVAATAG